MTEETQKLLELIEKAEGPVSLQQCVELPVFTKNINAARMIRSQVQNLHKDGHILRVGRGLYAPVQTSKQLSVLREMSGEHYTVKLPTERTQSPSDASK